MFSPHSRFCTEHGVKLTAGFLCIKTGPPAAINFQSLLTKIILFCFYFVLLRVRGGADGWLIKFICLPIALARREIA